MLIEVENIVTSSGVHTLRFLRDGKDWYADVGFPKEKFIIGAQVAYFICANFDCIKDFVDSDGLKPELAVPQEITMGRGFVNKVVWCRYKDFEIGDKTICRPLLKLEWNIGKVRSFSFGVEKAKAILKYRNKINELASLYS